MSAILGQLGRLGTLGGASTGGLTKAAMIARLTTLGAAACYLPSEYLETAWKRYDAIGGRPAVVGDPVGFLGDILQGMALGPERVVNGDFASGLTGWTGVGCVLSIVDGKMRMTATTSTTCYARQAAISGDNRAFFVTTGASIDWTGTGDDYIGECVPTSASGFAYRYTSSTLVQYNRRHQGIIGSYSDHAGCSMRQVLGRHSFQSAESLRPTLLYDGKVFYLQYNTGQSMIARLPSSYASTCTVIYAARSGSSVVVPGVAVTSGSVTLSMANSGLVIMPSTASTEAVAAVAAMVDVLARRIVV